MAKWNAILNLAFKDVKWKELLAQHLLELNYLGNIAFEMLWFRTECDSVLAMFGPTSNSNSFETMLHQCPTVLKYFQPHCDLPRSSKAATKLYRSTNGIWISVQVHRESEINLNLGPSSMEVHPSEQEFKHQYWEIDEAFVQHPRHFPDETNNINKFSLNMHMNQRIAFSGTRWLTAIT